MSVMLRRSRGPWVAMVSLVVLSGCQELGLPGRNTPEAEAAAREWRYDVYDVAGPADALPEVVLSGSPAAAAGAATDRSEPTRWLASAEETHIPASLLRPVANASGIMLYALSWDQAPYDRLYAAADGPDTYNPLHPVLAPARPHAADGEAEPGAH